MQLNELEEQLVLDYRRDQKRKIHGFSPDDLAAISTEEKCEEFDKLFLMALKEYCFVEANGRSTKDITNWMYEAVMQLLGEKVFDGINAYIE